MRQGRAVLGGEPPAHAPFIDAERWAPPGEIGRRLIVIVYGALGIGGVDGGRQGIEDLLKTLLGANSIRDICGEAPALDELAVAELGAGIDSDMPDGAVLGAQAGRIL